MTFDRATMARPPPNRARMPDYSTKGTKLYKKARANKFRS